MGLSIEARYLEPEIPPELDQTYRRTFARLKGLFRARGCTPEEAADLAQEAAMRAYVHVQRWGVSGEGLDPLINRIARNLLIDRHRRVAPHLVPLDSAGDVHDPGADPTEEIIRRQRSTEVRTAVQELPSRHQTAILYSMKGLTPAEVGDQLGIGRNAADALLHRARRSLRERLRHVGEGAYSFGLWIRIKSRNAAGRAGFGAPLEAVGAGSTSAGLTAAALIVAAINVVNPAGPAGDAPRSKAVTISYDRAGTQPVARAAVDEATPRGAGVTSVRVPGTGFGADAGDGAIRTGGEVKPPGGDDDGPSLLGLNADLVHDENGQTGPAGAYEAACAGNEQHCASLYREPVDAGEPAVRIRGGW